MRINSEDDFLIEQIFGWDVKKIREIQSANVFVKRIFLRQWKCCQLIIAVELDEGSKQLRLSGV